VVELMLDSGLHEVEKSTSSTIFAPVSARARMYRKRQQCGGETNKNLTVHHDPASFRPAFMSTSVAHRVHV
jgi:hypothetical protein